MHDIFINSVFKSNYDTCIISTTPQIYVSDFQIIQAYGLYVPKRGTRTSSTLSETNVWQYLKLVFIYVR